MPVCGLSKIVCRDHIADTVNIHFLFLSPIQHSLNYIHLYKISLKVVNKGECVVLYIFFKSLT